MDFENDNELYDFLDDKPYYSTTTSFCVGNDMLTAGKVIKRLVDDIKKGKEENAEPET